MDDEDLRAQLRDGLSRDALARLWRTGECPQKALRLLSLAGHEPAQALLAEQGLAPDTWSWTDFPEDSADLLADSDWPRLLLKGALALLEARPSASSKQTAWLLLLAIPRQRPPEEFIESADDQLQYIGEVVRHQGQTSSPVERSLLEFGLLIYGSQGAPSSFKTQLRELVHILGRASPDMRAASRRIQHELAQDALDLLGRP